MNLADPNASDRSKSSLDCRQKHGA